MISYGEKDVSSVERTQGDTTTSTPASSQPPTIAEVSEVYLMPGDPQRYAPFSLRVAPHLTES